MTARPWENARQWEPRAGWSFTVKRHAGHGCGWTMAAPFDQPAEFTDAWEAHEASCPWPEMPEPDETVSD